MSEAKMRPCWGKLCNGKMRWSEGPGDRFCKACKKLQGEASRHGKRATQNTNKGRNDVTFKGDY